MQQSPLWLPWAFLALLLAGCGSAPEEPTLPPGPPPTAADLRVSEWRALMATEQAAPELGKLTLVNDFFNRLLFEDDRIHWRREDYWATPLETIRSDGGDCEDFVLLKRRKLIEKGFSPADLLITVVRKPDGEGHAVLTMRTTEGDFILDNLETDVRHWTETPYRYLKRQAAFHPGRWVSIENGDAIMVSSVGK